MKLYKISGQYRELESMLDGADEGMAVAIRDTLQAIEGEFQEKAQAVVQIALNMDANCAAIDAEIERLKSRKQAVVNQANSLRDYLRTNMEATGISKISCPLFSITLAKGREVVVVDDESAIPDELVRVKTDISPDKTAIAAKLKAGEEVPGCHLERGQSSVRIK